MSTQIITDFFNAFPHIYCLSLARCNERRDYISAFFSDLNIEHFSFFDAFDADSEEVIGMYAVGKVKAFPDCFRCGKLECGVSECNNTLIAPQVATFLSYIALFKAFLESDHPFALFIEDDIKLVEHANFLCESLSCSDWLENSGLLSDKPAIVQLGWAYCKDHEIKDIASINSFLKKMSNPAFAVNRAMASKIIEEFITIETTVDIFIHREIAPQCIASTVYPPLFYEMSWSTGEVESTIHPKEKHIEYLEKTGLKKRDEIEYARKRLSEHKKHTTVYPILVIGHPRCGSGYMSALLKSMGVEIGHEALLQDGISSWMFATQDDCPWALNELARTRRFKYFRHVLHHVRDPRNAIPSIMHDNIHSSKSYDFRRKHILLSFGIDLDDYSSNFERAVASYIYWNQMILEQAPNLIVRVEDCVSKVKDYLLNYFDFSLKANPIYPLYNVNSNKLYQGREVAKPQVTTDNFSELPLDLLEKLNSLCVKFQYEEFPMADVFDKVKFISSLETQMLKPTGWLRSAEEMAPVAEDGSPLPWWTTPATEFINGILSKHWRVFEYGCGNSTLWWSKKVTQVIAVDHDKNWVDRVRPALTAPHKIILSEISTVASQAAIAKSQSFLNRQRKHNFDYDDAKMVRRGLNDEDFINYADQINQADGKFDCIVIDGMARRLCAEFAVACLNENGIIIFDNSNRSDYLEGYQVLVENGFYQIRFSGPVIGAPFPSCTSIFIKTIESLPKIVFEPSMFNIKEF